MAWTGQHGKKHGAKAYASCMRALEDSVNLADRGLQEQNLRQAKQLFHALALTALQQVWPDQRDMPIGVMATASDMRVLMATRSEVARHRPERSLPMGRQSRVNASIARLKERASHLNLMRGAKVSVSIMPDSEVLHLLKQSVVWDCFISSTPHRDQGKGFGN